MGWARLHFARADRSTDGRVAAAVAAVWVTVLLFVGVLSLRPWPDAPFAIDFVAFWAGAGQFREGAGASLYGVDAQHAFQVRVRLEQAIDESIRRAPGFIPYNNPPPVLLLFLPLAFLPIGAAFLLWSGLSLAAIAAAVALPLRRRPFARSTAMALLTLGGVADTLLRGQVDGLFLLAFSLALLALAADRPFQGGVLMGLLWLKPQYAALFALIFLVKGRHRELAGMAATGLSLAALSVAMVGLSGLARYGAILNEIGSFYPTLAATIIHPSAMINWRGLLVNVAPGLPEAVGFALMVGLGAATGLISLLAWRGPWDPASPRFARQMLVAVLATLVAVPHSHFHGTVLLLAPLALVLRHDGSDAAESRLQPERPVKPRVRVGGVLVLAVGYLLALAAWILVDVRWLLAPYFLVAMGVLMHEIRGESSGDRRSPGERLDRLRLPGVAGATPDPSGLAAVSVETNATDGFGGRHL